MYFIAAKPICANAAEQIDNLIDFCNRTLKHIPHANCAKLLVDECHRRTNRLQRLIDDPKIVTKSFNPSTETEKPEASNS